jgi:hypothetical protein
MITNVVIPLLLLISTVLIILNIKKGIISNQRNLELLNKMNKINNHGTTKRKG